MQPRSKLWQGIFSEPSDRKPGELYTPNAVAGIGPLRLPKGHWLHNAARPHDGWYEAVEAGEIEATWENKARADTEFLVVALIDARHIASHGTDEIQDYAEYAHLCSEATAAYLAIRSFVGDIAWRT